MQHIEFLIPGDIEALTGGYTYDREVAVALNSLGLQVSIRQLDEDLSQPAARDAAAHVLASLPAGSGVLIDGLALASVAELLTEQAQRLQLFALVHHPAALETGLSHAAAAHIDRLERKALQAMQGVICTSRWTARQLEDYGLPKQRIRVVEPGIDAAMVNAHALTTRREPTLAHQQGLRLICVATITPRKGHEILISALARLADLDWQLDCIGSLQRAPEHAAILKSHIVRCKLGDRVRLRDELGREPLAHAYARADLFVLASRLEGYGMVFAEARAAGLPIIATRGGAISETLENSSALVVDDDSLAPTLRKLMTDRTAWLDLAAAAQAQAREIRSWRQVATEFADALNCGARR